MRSEIEPYALRAELAVDAIKFGRCLCDGCRPNQIEVMAWHLLWRADFDPGDEDDGGLLP